jgi:hypothetical protein
MCSTIEAELKACMDPGEALEETEKTEERENTAPPTSKSKRAPIKKQKKVPDRYTCNVHQSDNLLTPSIKSSQKISQKQVIG